MLSNYLEFGFNLIIWSQGWPPMIWEATKPFVLEKVGDQGTLNYDFAQGILLIFALTFVEYIVSIPTGLFSQFMIADSHGFNK